MSEFGRDWVAKFPWSVRRWVRAGAQTVVVPKTDLGRKAVTASGLDGVAEPWWTVPCEMIAEAQIVAGLKIDLVW